MAYTHRWLNRTRIRVNRLEDRLQPGSLLLGGLDLAGVENILPRPDVPDTETETRKIIRLNTEETALVASTATTSATAKAMVIQQSAPADQPAQPSAPVDTSFLNSTPTKVARSVVSPAFRAPVVSMDADSSRPIAAQHKAFPSASTTFNTPVAVAIPLPPPEEVHGTKADASGLETFTTLDFRSVDCGETGTKAFVFNTYEGGITGPGSVDGTLAVATGKDGFIGETYTAGYQGTNGFIGHYTSSGACLPGAIFTSATGLRLTDVWVNLDGVYVTGTFSGGTAGFVAHLDFALTTATVVGKTAPAGGQISYEGVGTRPRGGPRDVYVTGMLRDPALGATERVMDFAYNPLLAGLPIYEVSWGFTSGGVPVDASGLEVDVDVTNAHYIGGKLDSTAAVPRPLTMRVSATPAIVWAFALTAGSPVADVDNGMHGVRVVDGATSAAGLYTSGVVRDTAVNPGNDLMLVAKWTKSTGTPLLYAFVYQIAGGEIGSYASAVDRAGNHYLAGYAHAAGVANDGHITKLVPTGGSISAQRLVGDLGGPADDRGTGVELVVNSATSDVVSSGETASAAILPGPLGCDTSFDGPQDGYVIKDAQPLGL